MIRALLLLLRALLQLLLRAVAATPLHPVHLLPLVKGRNNESSPKLRVYGAHLIVYADRTIICLLFNRFSTVLPEGSVYYTIVFLRSARRQLNKQTKRIIRLNDSTFPYKRKRNETITLTIYYHIPYVLKQAQKNITYVAKKQSLDF